MVGPIRPEFVLFGSSIVQLSFGLGSWGATLASFYTRKVGIRFDFTIPKKFGSSIVQLSFGLGSWGATLASFYTRKADIFVRGYSGWNSRQALQVLNQVFPRGDAVKPSLVIVYFGGNDAAKEQPNGNNSHVPLPEYVENMRTIANYLKGLSENTRLIFLTAPPVNESQLLHITGKEDHTNELRQQYADACEQMCQNLGIKAINLCTVFKQHDDWETSFFMDGMHFTQEGSQIVTKEILLALENADWEPSLYWKDMPSEFA